MIPLFKLHFKRVLIPFRNGFISFGLVLPLPTLIPPAQLSAQLKADFTFPFIVSPAASIATNSSSLCTTSCGLHLPIRPRSFKQKCWSDYSRKNRPIPKLFLMLRFPSPGSNLSKDHLCKSHLPPLGAHQLSSHLDGWWSPFSASVPTSLTHNFWGSGKFNSACSTYLPWCWHTILTLLLFRFQLQKDASGTHHPGFLLATWPCCLSPFYPSLSQKRCFERVHKICVVQSKYFVLPPHRSSNRPRFCDEKNVPRLHKTSPAAACSLTSKPAPKLNQRSPKIHILFLYFQNDCGFRTSLQLLTAAELCFWRREQ